MVSEVTDPDLLRQLDAHSTSSGGAIEDPDLIAQLEGGSPSGEEGWGGTLAKSAENVPLGFAQAAGGDISLAGRALSESPSLTHQMNAALLKTGGSQFSDWAANKLAENQPNVPEGSAKDYASQIGTGLGQSVPAIAAFGIGGPLAATEVGGLQGAGEKYAQVADKVPDADALKATGESAVVNALLAGGPASAMLKRGAPLLARLAEAGGMGALTSGSGSLADSAIDKANGINPDISFEDAMQRAKKASVVGTGAGVIGGAAGHVLDRGEKPLVLRDEVPPDAPTDQPLDLTDEVTRPTGAARTMDVANRIKMAESGGDPSAHSPNSTAGGLYQFTDATWKDMLAKYGKEFGLDKNADKMNPHFNELMGQVLTRENTNGLRDSLGREPTDGEIYAAHFLGLAGAKKLFSADQDAPAVSITGFKAADVNQSVFYDHDGNPRTVSEVRAELDRRIGQQPSGNEVVSSREPVLPPEEPMGTTPPTPQETINESRQAENASPGKGHGSEDAQANGDGGYEGGNQTAAAQEARSEKVTPIGGTAADPTVVAEAVAAPAREKARKEAVAKGQTRTYVPKPKDLLSFLVSKGGIRDTGGELRTMDAHRGRPGLVNNKRGMHSDDAALAAWEAGYFPGRPYGVGERPTTNDLHELIDASLRGKKHYSAHDTPPATEMDADQHQHELEQHYLDTASQLGVETHGRDIQDVMDDVHERQAIQTEHTDAGEQGVIPGAEKIGDRALAERQMEQPMRSGKAQKSAGSDGGLFDTEARNEQDLPFEPVRDTAASVAERQSSPFDAPEPKPREVPADNYTKPLSEHAPVMYRESHPSTAIELMPHSRVSADQGEVFLADHPDMATGQGTNKGGVQLAFDSSKLKGQISKAKPAWEFSWRQGTGEYVGKHNRQGDYQKALVGVRVPKDMKASKVEKAMLGHTLAEMEKNGWVKTEHEGFTEYTKPKDTAYAHASIGDTHEQIYTPDFAKSKDALKADLLAEAQRINPNVKVEFTDHLFGEGAALTASGAKSTERQEVGGAYHTSSMENVEGGHVPVDPKGLVEVSLNRKKFDPTKSLHHELFHSLQDGLLNDGEKAILAEKFPEKDGMPTYERQAYAFADFLHGRANASLTPAIRRAFTKIRDYLSRVGNLLRGRGFKSVDSIFAAADRGDIGRRTPEKGYMGEGGHGTQSSYSRQMKQTDTPAFKRWFGKSKVVDEKGEPLVVYHGTSGDVEQFSHDSIGKNYKADKVGIFFADDPMRAGWAASDALENVGGAENIVPVYLKIKNPLIIKSKISWEDSTGHFDSNKSKILNTAKKDGHDGIIVRGNTGESMYMVFDPTQIKSAIGNNGEFSPNDARIAYSVATHETPEQTEETFRKRLAAAPTIYEKAHLLAEGPASRLPQAARDLANSLFHEIKMFATPLAAGSERAAAVAKKFANLMRAATWQRNEYDKYITKNFDHTERGQMWSAMDDTSVHVQQAMSGGMDRNAAIADAEAKKVGIFADGLSDKMRANLQAMSTHADRLYKHAQELGMVEGEGLPFWTPRMAAVIGADGTWGAPKGGRPWAKEGRNVTTTSQNLKYRKHLMAGDTEAAMKALFGDDTKLVKDIRTMPLAMGRLEQALVGRELINAVRDIGKMHGIETVGTESRADTFTVDHPAFKIWRPKLVKDADGKWKVLNDENGKPVMEQVPLYINKEFEGPLKSIFSHDAGISYRGYMAFRNKVMNYIMLNPLIHNQVEFGRAFMVAPKKFLKTLTPLPGVRGIYGEGKEARKDSVFMREMIESGLVPKQEYGGIYDVGQIISEPQIKPGRSLESKLAGGAVGLLNKQWGEATKRGIDAAGKFWHDTMLWERIADLQVGLAKHMSDDLMRKGLPKEVAYEMAAHGANQYAGFMPREAMGNWATKIATVNYFSRTFTFGNLSILKDVMTGLPKENLARIEEFVGKEGRNAAARRGMKMALGIVAADMALNYAVNAIAQDAFGMMLRDETLDDVLKGYARRWHKMTQDAMDHPYNVLEPFYIPDSMTPLSENEPGMHQRVYFSRDASGRAYYMRIPFGKIGEEFQNWISEPLNMENKKEGTIVKPLYEIKGNQDHFHNEIYDADAKGVTGAIQNFGKVVGHIMSAQSSFTDAFKPITEISNGTNPAAETMNWYKLAGSALGFTFSKGYPGGPEVGDLMAQRRHQDNAVKESIPAIREKIQAGDEDGARDMMNELKMPPRSQANIINTTKNPAARLSGSKLRDFNQSATPDEKDQFQRHKQESDRLRNSLKSGDVHGALEAIPDNLNRSQAVSIARDSGLPALATIIANAPRLNDRTTAAFMRAGA